MKIRLGKASWVCERYYFLRISVDACFYVKLLIEKIETYKKKKQMALWYVCTLHSGLNSAEKTDSSGILEECGKNFQTIWFTLSEIITNSWRRQKVA